MQISSAIILLAFVAQTHAATQDSPTDMSVDKVVERALNTLTAGHSDLDDTTLEKVGQLAMPKPSAALRTPLVPGHMRVSGGFRTSASRSSDHLPQISRGPTVARAGISVSESRMAQGRPESTLQVPQKESAPNALLSEASLIMMEKEELLNGQAVRALRRFSDAMEALPAKGWESRMRPAFAEMAINLESFNPVFTACLLQVQMTLGVSDYERRDQCLQRLIQPLAGEYGLHEAEPLGKTHRALFREWFESTMGGQESLEALLQDSKCSTHKAEWLFQRMISDVENGGQGSAAPGASATKMEKACYALGYNLAVEYLANPEKTWLLESFQKFDEKALAPLGRQIEYEFLVVHAIGEKEHAHLGHEAAALFVPQSFEGKVRQAMRDHDRDLATYYNHLADILEGKVSAQC
eukprot:gnl/MRDRNA2_/MRDRNA2_123687_c0_seq1.p1 gnl/MRDRNA2_/MRDRNA2_123687_c0~~gnl/MRDRNA2_/MRDRNA2_123687_c0_seq1.p1  ORF type:complete len:410 (+),score=92.79 gnl/MRDRNA2_/MRDRNA2_123687_c0_seq1:85-1314(+)